MMFKSYSIGLLQAIFFLIIILVLCQCNFKKKVLTHYGQKEYDKSVISIEDETIRKLSKSLKIDASFQTVDKNVLIFKNSENNDAYSIQFPTGTETTIYFDVDMEKANTSNEDIPLHKILNSFSIANIETIQFKHNKRTLLSFKQLKIDRNDLSFNDPEVFLLNIIASMFPLLLDSDHFDDYDIEFIDEAIHKVDIGLIKYRLKEGSEYKSSQIAARIGNNSSIKIVNGNYDLFNNVVDGNLSLDINLENCVHQSDYARTNFDDVNFSLLSYDFYNSEKEFNLIKTRDSKAGFNSTDGQLNIVKDETLVATMNNFNMDLSSVQIKVRNSDIDIDGNATLNLDIGPIYYETSDNLVKIHAKEFQINELAAHFSGDKSNIDKIELEENVLLIIDSMTYQKGNERLSLYESSIVIHPTRFDKYGSSEILILDSLKFSANSFVFKSKDYRVSSTNNSRIHLVCVLWKIIQTQSCFHVFRKHYNSGTIIGVAKSIKIELESSMDIVYI